MNSNELLDALKKYSDVPSDYALAKRVLKVDVTAIRDMRERGLSDERVLQIATLMGIDPSPIIADIHAERAKDPKTRKVWETIAKTIRSAAAGVLIVLGLSAIAPQPVQAAFLTGGVIHYAKSRRRRSWTILCGFLGLFGMTSPSFSADWSNADTGYQAAYLTLHAVDWAQTRYSSRHPELFYEKNPVLGEHPSIGAINRYFIGTALIHTAISYALPPGWRRGWQMVTIGMEAGVVGYNYSLGVKMDF